MRNKKTYVSLLIFCFFINFLKAQQSSRNGYWSSNNGTIRMFIVFAEAVGDPYDTYSYDAWPRGQMPTNPNYLLDHFFNSSSINGMVTKLYNQASFGNLNIIGDYYPQLVQINYNNINYDGMEEVFDYLDNRPGTDLITAHGYSFNGTSFDYWEVPSGYGVPKVSDDDNYIDMVFILWRVNSKVSTYNNSGHIACSYITRTVKQQNGFHDRSTFTSFSADGWGTLRHEFAHSLMGTNGMHTAGNVNGARVFIAPPGGYSILNYSAAIGTLYNGYDRYKLGWKKSTNNYYISARKASDNTEINADMVYGQSFPGGTNEYILRDFVSTGDAIRIKLPYLKSEISTVYDQWLWLENHQIQSGNMDLNYTDAKGLYSYVQVGKESFTEFSGLAGYLYPLHPLGHYDIEYDLSTMKSGDDLNKEFSQFGETDGGNIKAVDKIILKYENSNAFTGYNIIMSLAYNITDPNYINGTNYYNEIFRDELIQPSAVELNGVMLPQSDFSYLTYPCFGTKYDAFKQGDKISISDNPAPVSVLTYYTQGSSTARPYASPQNYDNRKIYLNGLSIEVLEQRANGDIKVKVRWDDFDVNSDVRWCGPIVLNESIYLKSGKSITLDQGLTPTKPVNPMIFNGEKVFADYTTLTCKNSSFLKMESNSKLIVKNNSALVLESGSNLEINDDAVLRVESGSTLHLKSGANIIIKDAGKIEIEDGGYICIENGVNIDLQDNLSVINLRSGYNSGVNPNVIINSPSCLSNPASIVVSGNGSINTQYYQDTYIQNETIISNRYITGRNIYIGYAVTTSLPQGNVIINNGSKVILDAEYNIILEDGFEVELGGEFEIK